MGIQRKRTKGALSTLAVTAAIGVVATTVSVTAAGPAAAVPAKLVQDYSCVFPLINADPIKITITADIPDEIQKGQATPAFEIDANTLVSSRAAQGLGLVGAKTLEGKATADVTVNTPSGPLSGIKVENDVAKGNIPSPPADFTVVAKGNAPSLTFDKTGDGSIDVNNISLHDMIARDANGKPVQLVTGKDTFDAACTLTSTDKTLHRFKVVDNNPTNPTNPTSPTNPTNPTNPTSPTNPTNPTNPTSPTNPTNPTNPTSPTNPTNPTNPNPPIHLGYGLTGSSVIKASNGTAALAGGIEADFDLASGTYNADLTLNPTSGKFSILGFLPATAKIEFQQVGRTNGTLNTAGDLTAKSSMYVKLPEIAVFGIPLGGGADCKTGTPADVNLTSDGRFDPLGGGKLKGTYTLPPLKSCGAFNDILSAFTSGPGNTINMTLAKKG
ncbi:DUF6801 domain-containing protein [Streptomyces noboritoensis]|uniref:DUF6801 domain-containing protein n=1 Tax=Streptomyces noboritoensis TaxID=67337 RepID=A0ABV6TH95_9ACTN